MTTTPRLGMTQLEEGQALPEVIVNGNHLFLEQGANGFIVKDKDLATPPGSPAEGDAYIVAASATGAWTGWEKRIAFYYSGWSSITPIEGTEAWVQDENLRYRYDGAAWAAISSTIGAGSIGPTELASTAVTPGSYTNTDLTVDADGRITAASNGAGGAGGFVNRSFTETLVNASGTTIIPIDNTTPQITEGVECLSLTITPTSATARIRVEAVIQCQTSIASNWQLAAMFINGGANAVRAQSLFTPTASQSAIFTLIYEYVPGVTSLQTISVRAGLNAAGTITFNSGGSASLGGVIKSTLTAHEVDD